jgi:hypothetical protein
MQYIKHFGAASFFSIFFVITASAQLPGADEDNDGVPNSEDACPSVFGTKANKGCPGEATQNSEYISSEVFTKLMNTICAGTLPSIASNQKDGNLTIANLPLVGKQKNLPIMFNVFPNKTAEVYCMLSETTAEIEAAAKEVLGKLNNSGVCNNGFSKAFFAARKDTFAIIIPAVAGNKYYEMGVYAHAVGNGNRITVFSILDYNRVITAAEVEAYNKMVNSGNASTDREAEFCRKLKDVVSDFSSGFSLLKWDATEDTLFGLGDTYRMKETYLPFFTEKEMFVADEELRDLNYFEATINGLKETDALQLLQTFEKRIESCFNTKGVVSKPKQQESRRIVFSTGTTTMTSVTGENDVAVSLALKNTTYTGYEFVLRVEAIDVKKERACNELEAMTASQKASLENEITVEYENILREAKNGFTKYQIGFLASSAGYGNDKYAKNKPNLKFVYNWDSKSGSKETVAIVICQIVLPAAESYINALKLLEKKHNQMGLSPRIVTSKEGTEYFLGNRVFIHIGNYKEANFDVQLIFREQK